MNINEILKNDYDLCCKELKKATKKIEKQDKEIERLNNIIDKAIEYIENDLKSFLYSIEYKILLDILKGEGNDSNSNRI